MMTKKGKIFILSGPSGSGKTTLYRRLLESPGLKNKIIKMTSITTRTPREGEKHGKDYFFVSRKLFQHKKKAGHFLENMKVFDNYYGTPKKAVVKALREGKNVLLCIDVKGSRVVCRKFPEAVSVFIKSRSQAELRKRLLGRGSEDSARVRLRLATAKKELKESGRYKYTVVNDKLPEAQHQLEKIILSEISA